MMFKVHSVCLSFFECLLYESTVSTKKDKKPGFEGEVVDSGCVLQCAKNMENPGAFCSLTALISLKNQL
jgi:hypothetical protein